MKYSLAAIFLCAIYLGLLVHLPLFNANAKDHRDFLDSLAVPIPQAAEIVVQTPPQTPNTDPPSVPTIAPSSVPAAQPSPVVSPVPVQNSDEQISPTPATVVNSNSSPSPTPSPAATEEKIAQRQSEQTTQTDSVPPAGTNGNISQPQTQSAPKAPKQLIPTPVQTDIVSPIPQKEVIAPQIVNNKQQATSAEVYNPQNKTQNIVTDAKNIAQSIPVTADKITYPFYEYLGISQGTDRWLLLLGLSFTALGMVFLQPFILLEFLRNSRQKAESLLKPEDYFYIPKIYLPTTKVD